MEKKIINPIVSGVLTYNAGFDNATFVGRCLTKDCEEAMAAAIYPEVKTLDIPTMIILNPSEVEYDQDFNYVGPAKKELPRATTWETISGEFIIRHKRFGATRSVSVRSITGSWEKEKLVKAIKSFGTLLSSGDSLVLGLLNSADQIVLTASKSEIDVAIISETLSGKEESIVKTNLAIISWPTFKLGGVSYRGIATHQDKFPNGAPAWHADDVCAVALLHVAKGLSNYETGQRFKVHHVDLNTRDKEQQTRNLMEAVEKGYALIDCGSMIGVGTYDHHPFIGDPAEKEVYEKGLIDPYNGHKLAAFGKVFNQLKADGNKFVNDHYEFLSDLVKSVDEFDNGVAGINSPVSSIFNYLKLDKKLEFDDAVNIVMNYLYKLEKVKPEANFGDWDENKFSSLESLEDFIEKKSQIQCSILNKIMTKATEAKIADDMFVLKSFASLGGDVNIAMFGYYTDLQDEVAEAFANVEFANYETRQGVTDLPNFLVELEDGKALFKYDESAKFNLFTRGWSVEDFEYLKLGEFYGKITVLGIEPKLTVKIDPFLRTMRKAVGSEATQIHPNLIHSQGWTASFSATSRNEVEDILMKGIPALFKK